MELKGERIRGQGKQDPRVPNLPCGVESFDAIEFGFDLLSVIVPNLPCGVESMARRKRERIVEQGS